MTTWRIYPTSTNVGVQREVLERAGVKVGGFDHRIGAYVGCRSTNTVPAIPGPHDLQIGEHRYRAEPEN